MITTRPWWEQFPYGRPETQQGLITPSNTNFQLMRIPYPNPDNAKTIALAIMFSNPGAVAAVVKIWDQDLTDLSTNTQAANRGAVNNPILQFNIPPSGDVITEVYTRPYFQGGIAAQSTVNNMFYSIYVVHIGMG